MSGSPGLDGPVDDGVAVGLRAGRPLGRRIAALIGVDSAPRGDRLFAFAVLLAAVAVAVGGLLQPVHLPAGTAEPSPARFGLATTVVFLAQAVQLRFRVGPGVIGIAWGEAALIVSLYLVPPGWIPAAVLAGSLAGRLASGLLTEPGKVKPYVLVHIAALLSLGGAAGAAVVVPLANPYDAELTPTLAAVLGLSAMVYMLVTLTLTALTAWLRYRLPFGQTLGRSLRTKALMFVGNVVVSLVIVELVQIDPWWLVLLPPAMWLLQQTYADRMRAGGERRTWQVFASATRALNQLDERGVAVAGVRGAVMLFAPRLVEVEVARLDGRRHCYSGDGDGDVTESKVSDEPPPAGGGGLLATRALVVGGIQVGELRLHFNRPAALAPRDQMALSAFSDALGAALHDAATHRELRVMSARTLHEALHDPLTGLINRAALLAKGDGAVRMLNWDTPVALLLLDVDHFKEVNDTLGHAAGDALLQTTATRLGELTRPGELLARLGGDEFALLLTSLPAAVEPSGLRDRPAPLVYALRRARELTGQLAVPTEVAGVRLSVEASVGVVVAPAGSADMTELLRRADIAMYQAKKGGASVAWYDSASDAASTDRLALIAELREALNVDDQLVLALQPAVDLNTGAPTGVEALIRWKHPRRGQLGPADFVRAVEDSELLGPFTRYVIDKALSAAAEWSAHGLDVPVAVNLSARNLLDPGLPADVAELLRHHRVPPHRLVVEITETVVMSELDVVDEVLAGLRDLGVQLAVDDFGTGYSSLTFLTRIAVDELKVDRTFVRRMADSAEAAAIVRTTVDLARELGLRVVAEGVETADQRSALEALGCTAAQGFHFYRPMPAENVVAVLLTLMAASQPRVVPLRADGAS